MECLVCGVPLNTEEMLKYIRMGGDRGAAVKIKETAYQFMQCSVIISEEEVLYGIDSGKSRTAVKVLFPPDRSRSRKVLARRTVRSTVCSAEEIEKVLLGIGAQNRQTREYTRKTYEYKETQVDIVGRDGKELVVVRTEDKESGEAIIEEVKNKLRIWVDLQMPPQEVWDLVS